MKNRWALAVGVSLAAFVSVTTFAAEPTTNPGLLASANGVRDVAHARDLRLAKFDVTVRVHGAVAQTEVIAPFANTGTEILEGDFTLALPKGAIVTGYALDIDGRMVDGVLVERPKAKAVYEERVRRGADPGLAEVTTADVFTTRVFPIPAMGGRTIRLRFVSMVGADGYRLPLHFDAPSEGWSITTGQLGVPGSIDVTSTGKGALDSPVTIRPVTPEPVLASQTRAGEIFLQLAGNTPSAGARPTERLRIYWDRSRSRRDDRHDAELALLRRVLTELKPVAIEVVTFNSSGAERLAAADPDAAVEHLREVRYRGATSFAALRTENSADRCLLFSDGRVTIDREAVFAPRCRLQAVTTSATADMAWLRHIAATRGGRAYALAEDGAEVAAAIAREPAAVGAVTDDAGNALAFVPVETGAGHWAAVVRAPGQGGVRVTIARVEQRLAQVQAPVAFDGDAALLAVDDLATLGGTDQRAQFVATSRRYGVASPSLSFVVLETPGDYLTADVAPPASYPRELQANYKALIKAGADEKVTAKRERFAEVAERWDEQVAWWKMRFDPMASRKRAAGKASNGDFAMPPPPPPPAPPPLESPPPPMITQTPAPPALASRVQAPQSPHAGSLANEATDAGDIIVTSSRADTTTIALDAWQPDRAYLKVFDAAPAAFDRRFDAEEAKAGDVPAFYLDTAEWLRRRGRTADAVEMVLAALELPSSNEVTLGIVADRLERYGAIDRAIELRERHAALDPDRPQPRRLLALALARRARLQPGRARADLTRAVALLSDVALTPFDSDWDGIDTIALTEANALIPRLRAAGGTVPLDPRFVALLDTDMRVVVDWTTNATDLDLWVDEASGERAIYNNPRTRIGGHLSNDMTQGYGPEEYFLRRAPGGTYTVQANVFASDRIDPNGLSLLTAHLIRYFGRPGERDEAVDIELQRDEKGQKMVGRIVVGRPVK